MNAKTLALIFRIFRKTLVGSILGLIFLGPGYLVFSSPDAVAQINELKGRYVLRYTYQLVSPEDYTAGIIWLPAYDEPRVLMLSTELTPDTYRWLKFNHYTTKILEGFEEVSFLVRGEPRGNILMFVAIYRYDGATWVETRQITDSGEAVDTVSVSASLDDGRTTFLSANSGAIKTPGIKKLDYPDKCKSQQAKTEHVEFLALLCPPK